MDNPDFHLLSTWCIKNHVCRHFIVDQKVSLVLLLKKHSFCNYPVHSEKVFKMNDFVYTTYLGHGDSDYLF